MPVERSEHETSQNDEARLRGEDCKNTTVCPNLFRQLAVAGRVRVARVRLDVVVQNVNGHNFVRN